MGKILSLFLSLMLLTVAVYLTERVVEAEDKEK